ncbi:MAG: STAS domain-containing protein [Candidatus Latescibacterota bacterium]|nr:MAG: STAS domain-containing protein [Candidatus Latescibacterota bacterium]
MHLIVRSIDFTNHAITIEVDQSTSLSHHDHIAWFIGFCTDLGFSDVKICYPKNLPLMSFVMLQEMQKKRDSCGPVTLSPRERVNAPSSRDACQFHCTVPRTGEWTDVEYQFRCSDFPDVLEHLTLVSLLIGYSVPFDEESLSYLRLCTYELGANTVEHGTFQHDNPEATVKIVIRGDHFDVTYSDNAEQFATTHIREVDIAKNIRTGSKRGLGLYLLQKITQDLTYTRDAIWNRTNFKIKRRETATHELNRRAKMNTLSITVTPTESKNTAVIRPVGSINSATVPQLDACFGDLVGKGQRTIVIDLSETEFISSSGVGLLLGTVSSLRDKSGDLVLMNIPTLINDIFDILNIKIHFRIIKSLDELKIAANP